MPIFRVETLEACPTRRVFEVEADDVKDAIEAIESGEYELGKCISSTPAPEIDWSSGSAIQFVSVMPANLPLAAWKAMGQPVCGPISEAEHLLIRERMGRPAKPPVVEIKDEPAPESKPNQELLPYTVVLLVPDELQEKAGQAETFVGHTNSTSVSAAIEEAQYMATVERDCAEQLLGFAVLVVFPGHHDELIP